MKFSKIMLSAMALTGLFNIANADDVLGKTVPVSIKNETHEQIRFLIGHKSQIANMGPIEANAEITETIPFHVGGRDYFTLHILSSDFEEVFAYQPSIGDTSTNVIIFQDPKTEEISGEIEVNKS